MRHHFFSLQRKTTLKKILIVDDDKDLLFNLTAILSKKMYKILAINDGAAALDTASRFHPDVILLDVNLEDDIDGKDVCNELKKNSITSQIPIMMMSAQITKAEIKKTCHPDDFIEKPFKPNILFTKIEALIA